MITLCQRLGLLLTLGAASVSAQSTPLIPSHTPTAPAKAAPVSLSTVVARVNGTGLTERDLQREMSKLFPYAGVHRGRIPGEYAVELRQQARNQIVFDELLHQEALRRKMTVPAATLADVMRQARERFPSLKEYQEYAVREYGSVQAFEAQIRRALLIALLLDKEITEKARVSEAEIKQLYAQNPNRFRKPESVWIQSISLNFPPNATPAQRTALRERARNLLALAKATGSFEEFGRLAEKFSEDDWRIMMGDHKWIHRGRLPAAVEAVAFQMKAGEVSGIIETSEALVIVRINGVQPARQIPFSEVSAALREELEKAKLADARRQFEKYLRKTFVVEEL
jgi:parvulin-like peptidyl-prolyl isomerase